MSREFEVTEGMMDEAFRFLGCEDGPSDSDIHAAFCVMTAHPDFRAQLRKWAADEMRGLVPATYKGSHPSLLNEYESGHWEACAETLANIERWANLEDAP